MTLRRFAFSWLLFLLGVSLFVAQSLVIAPADVYAQDDDVVADDDAADDDVAADDDAADDDTADDTGGNTPGGVFVDSQGILRRKVSRDPTGALTKQRFQAARAALNRDFAKQSPLRKVSLNRLEAELKKRLAKGHRPTSEMRYLAGLTNLKYVFYYPESNDIVIAGEAEGWAKNTENVAIGIHSGRPVLRLDDLIVALRSHPPNGKKTHPVYVSIDPTQEGLKRMQSFLQQIGGRATPRDTPLIVQGLQKSLGLQTITISGVSPKTHFASVLVEADYRMKLIGIGLEVPPVKIPSYVSRVNPASVARNALQRWYFVPNYECVRVAEDNLAMELVGNGVKLVGEDEFVNQEGNRASASLTNRASQVFVQAFTQRYPQISQKMPVYAELRNLIDMLIATAFIQDQDYYGQSGWNMDLFLNEKAYPVERFNSPQKVATAVNSMWKGNRLMTPVGGGVQIEPWRALKSGALLSDEEGKVQKARQESNSKSKKSSQWWWD